MARFFLNFSKDNGQNLEPRNVERPIFRNYKITNVKITKDGVEYKIWNNQI